MFSSVRRSGHSSDRVAAGSIACTVSNFSDIERQEGMQVYSVSDVGERGTSCRLTGSGGESLLDSALLNDEAELRAFITELKAQASPSA